MYSSSPFRSIGIPLLLVIAAILSFAGLRFETTRPPQLSARSTTDVTHFYEDIAAELAASTPPPR
ncbi:MAG TPA: hypothetical protein VJU77_15565 [Chthoniobacterales bacterium]|nr:hypothetical protein [Chthoniobacterales bacterium]